MKNALIVGGSRGLGLGLVQEHLNRGWKVTATERSRSSALHQLAEQSDGLLMIRQLDITDQNQQRDLAKDLADQTFDLLFLNAGILTGWGQRLSKISDAEISDKFLTNAIGPIRAADALRGLLQPNGMIAFMSSRLGSIACNDDGRGELYRASKAALNSLVLSYAARHNEAAHTILLLHPGVVRTAMGGPNAPLDIETSVAGLADVIERRWGERQPVFVDYRNQVIPW